MNDVYHYAPWAYLPRIVESGELRPSNVGAPGEKAMLWFSAHSHWEPTATKVAVTKDGVPRRLTFDEQVQRSGCIRFALSAEDARLINWEGACAAAGTPRGARRALERVGRKMGANPSHWVATAVPIPLAELRLQVFIGTWGNADANEMAKVWAQTHAA